MGKPDKAPTNKEQPVKKKPKLLPDVDESNRKYKDGTYTGTAMGFNDDITVEVTITNGEIAAIEIVSEKEDAEYLLKAKGVITAILKTQSTNVDAVSGATYSSYGIIKEVRAALNNAVIDTDEKEEIVVPGPDDGYNPVYGQYTDGQYTGKAAGYEGYIFVKVTIAGGNITDIEVTRHIEEAAYWRACTPLINRVIFRQTLDGIDTVAGATYTSRGILFAIGEALEKAKLNG